MKNDVPIIPVTTVLKERSILGKTMKPPWVKIITVISLPVFPPHAAEVDNRDLAAFYAEAVRKIMQEVINGNGGDKELFSGKIST